MARKSAALALEDYRPDGNGFDIAAAVAHILAGAFGLIGLLRIFW
jgi:hypothetical protein